MSAASRTQLLAIPGVLLVVGFFMPWIDLLGLVNGSGYDLATADIGPDRRYLLWLSPLAGVALAVTALADSKSARNMSLLAGAVVMGPFCYYVGKAMLFGTSWGLWMVVAGAISLIVLAAANKTDSMLLPAGMIIAGFLLPWTTKDGSFASWGASGFDIARASLPPIDLGLPDPKVAYLVPLAGVAAGVSVLLRANIARTVGTIAGVVVLGWLVYFVGKSFGFLTGWGLWMTLAAGTGAVIMGLRR